MAKGKQTRLSQKKKVIAAKLADPELSLRDIEKQTGVNRQTTSDIIKEIPEILTGTDKGVQMIEDINEIILKATSITRKHLDQMDAKESLTTKDTKLVNEIAEINFKRKQILEGKPTEITSTKVDLNDLTPKQIEELKNQYL